MVPDDIDSTSLRAMTGPSLLPQTLLLHTYEVEQLLASGGMGEVYLARHTELGTRHAIKVIKPQLMVSLSETDVLGLFRREAAILRDIHNDAVIGYEGFFRDEQKNVYLVTEYIDGPSLAQVLAQHALSLQEVYLLRDRLCKGLAAVHEKGVIHRDISPDNVILAGGDVNRAKLIDFGIAKLTDPSNVTIIGNAFVGKLRYAAPEQLGRFGGTVSPATDIYSLGLVLAAAALGGPFYMGNSIQTALEARQKVPDLRAIPALLQPQLMAMLQPNPADRPQRTTDLLQRWPIPPTLNPDNVVIEVTPDLPKVESRFRKYRVHLLVFGVGILLAVGFGFFSLLGLKPPATPAGVDMPGPTPPGATATVEQPTAPPVEPAVNLVPPTKPEVKEVPSAIAPGATATVEQPAAPPVEPAVKEVPGAAAPGMATTGRQPAPPPAELDIPKIAPKLKKKPPTATDSPPSPPKATPSVRPTQTTSDERGQQTLPSSRDGGSKSRRCGDILARMTLGESLSNEDRIFLKECR